MNRTYRNIWNAATGTWTAAAETAKSRSKGSARVARGAVIALALGGASIGGVAAAEAEACKTPDGTNGVVDASGICTVPSIGTSSIGTLGSETGQNTTYGLGSSANPQAGSAFGASASANGRNSTAIGNGATAVSMNNTAIGTSANAAGEATTALGMSASASGYHSVALGVSAAASGRESVAIGVSSVADRDNAVSIGSATLRRQIINIAAGTALTDVVNVAQLTPVVTALGGGAKIDATTGAVTGPSYTLTNGGTQTTIGGALSALDTSLTAAKGSITQNTGDIKTLNDKLSNLPAGLVQQASARANLTVGAGTDGAAVDFTGTAGTRKLTGVTAGTVSATSTDAVNGAQLHGTADSVAKAIGAGSTVNADGSISAPSFTVGDGNGGTTTVSSIGSAVTNLDGRVTTNEGAISTIRDEMSSGTIGLVQQAGAGANLTVGANTDGKAVNFTGTDGNRKLTGIQSGDVVAGSTDAVTGGQLYATNLQVQQNTSDIAGNKLEITNLNQQLANGQIGLVQQDPTSGAITVAAASAGSVVNFAGTNGARTLSGVANASQDDEAVTLAQLKASGLVDKNGKELGAVVYDDIGLGSVTFGGTGGTKLMNIAPGLIGSGSMDAVNGGQLYDLQQQFAQQYAQLDGRVGDLETGSGGGGGGGGGGWAPGTGENSLVVGDGTTATGKNGSAVGNGAAASGDNSSAFGQGAVASGPGSTAVGQGSAASGANSTAMGQGSNASGSNSVALGAGSVADRDNSVSVGSAGNERQITNVAPGTAGTDAVNVNQLNGLRSDMEGYRRDAYAGTASAVALGLLPQAPAPGKSVLGVAGGNYAGQSAVAFGLSTYTANGKWILKGGGSTNTRGTVAVGASAGYVW
ncbi:YadA-like family protein [Burkholderia sp. Cy-637]|uniref:YadA family autotransporter adhesin n=1 Tax=Burkholderia sp. Cy-637 TaxID=2608327 RepID=UPI0014235F3D|nr:YadA-like family protein [Burkholderia sp. Cy-637]NIF88125.1 transporter [Burkholderia sp. Cy-637]